ncbi:hypothetical protein KIW84_055070 [Lathyrus oleraceus]|uniref:CCHC-type domain-containing protein n=1 Tax=Pisum sativum TaxID=3888 RepID=A0A9D4WUU8_PEA|nr:hypothetical protein KIW84_055070 [Pisum sativum]
MLNTEPLPSLRRVFNHAIREEARNTSERGKMVTVKGESGGSAFYAPNQNRLRRDGQKPKCDHCGKVGHTKAGCFEITGYPENWGTRRTQRYPRDNGGQPRAYHAHDIVTKKKIGLSDVHGGVYVLRQEVQGSAFKAHHENEIALWHAHMGHPSSQVTRFGMSCYLAFT